MNLQRSLKEVGLEATFSICKGLSEIISTKKKKKKNRIYIKASEANNKYFVFKYPMQNIVTWADKFIIFADQNQSRCVLLSKYVRKCTGRQNVLKYKISKKDQ